ncbi:hypothetical protein [Ramlibacter sp.]|uniref:hypothetical protein n=1 Tax=Ramlibacter sp. TaxID=1917967 RepID=UPI002D52850F|nr:hypothetical protein [Ramlibacter sp.]HYD77473.1 hypothetical protein [Ramlibacter sp.]
MKLRLLSAALLAAVAGSAAFAKLPPLTPEAQAKADETKAKAAWTAKVSAYQLCKAQDRIAGKFGGKSKVQVPAGAVQPAAASSAAPATAAAQPSQPAPAAAAAAASAARPASGSAAAGTPVAAAPAAPCVDPGPFAYTAPSEKPLETSGAHSPAGTAATPPSVRPEAAEMKPGAAAPASK